MSIQGGHDIDKGNHREPAVCVSDACVHTVKYCIQVHKYDILMYTYT